jgi:hypothetical protein
MKTQDVDFQFPVLGFTPDEDIWAFPDLNALTSCGRKTLREDMQANMELVDAGGRRWIVRAVRRTGRAQSLLMWIISHLISTPQSRIEHELEAMPPISIEETKKRVCASMRVFPGYYGDSDEVDADLEARIAEVRATKSNAEILDVLGLDSFMAY